MTTWAHCNNCGRSTSHDVVASEKVEDYVWNLYEMLKCRGCERVIVRHTCELDKFITDVSGATRTLPSVVYYPPPIARRAPDWITDEYKNQEIDDGHVPAPICAVMREVYTAVQNNSRRLAAMGIRAALESVMIQKAGDQGKFTKNVDALQNAGYLSTRQALSLTTILDAGHATIHREWVPTDGDIVTLLDITESIIETVYLHEYRARDLDRNIPKRPRPGSES